MAEAMDVEVITSSNEVTAAMVRGEIDSQIATARKFPRDIRRVQQSILTEATLDKETAAACRYVMPRDGKMIEGPSIRFAEIVSRAWGNLRVGTRVIGIDEHHITVQGLAHDLETNVAITAEVKRRVTKRDGTRYSDDMIVTTANAASSIAFRGAALRVIPQSFWRQAFDASKKMTESDERPLAARQEAAVGWFRARGVPVKQLLVSLGHGVTSVNQITPEDLLTLQGIRTAIMEETMGIADAFPAPDPEQVEPQSLAEVLEKRGRGGRPKGSKNKSKGSEAPVAAEPEPPAETPKEV